MAVKKSIYDYAMELGYSNKERIEKAKAYQEETNVTPAKAMIDTKVVTEEILLDIFNDIYGFDMVKNISDVSINKEFALRFDVKQLIKLGMLPQYCNKTLKIITCNPASTLIIEDYVKETTGFCENIEYFLITESNLRRLINRTFDTDEQPMIDVETIEIIEDNSYRNNIYDVTNDDISGIVTLVNRIFLDAVNNGISDVHIEPQEDYLRIRFRDDGILKQSLRLPRNIMHQVVNRIKTMSSLDVNSNKIVQDGNVCLDTFGKLIDLRVSVLPAVCGENLVVRLLDQSKIDFNIGMLGFSPENESIFRKIISRPDGMLLMTGPTGSGKSTSLYAALSILNNLERCIITLEDPVEYRLPGLIQVPINPAMGLTFPMALRSALRQDPDTLLIGEIRDAETAEIAIQASNTGHMVFSTLHTNSAASSIMRLVEMGVDSFMVATTLSAVINQRLVRKVCHHCKEEYYLDEHSPYRKILNFDREKIILTRGRGCEACGGTGWMLKINTTIVI